MSDLRCHLESAQDGPLRPTRSVCSCGWAGQWFTSGARAVEDGSAHLLFICKTCGRASEGPVGAAVHASLICPSRRR